MNSGKKLCSILLGIFLASRVLTLQAQDATPPFMVYPSITVGIGFFYPGHVNEYIEDEIIAGYSDAVNTELYAFFEVRGGLTFRMKRFDFGAMLEYDIAPKFVMVTGGDNFTYSYSRIAPELSANIYFPGNSGKNAFFVGAGINYSFMKFEEYNASSPGVAVRAGYSMQFKSINIQPYGLFRLVKGSDPSGYDYQGTIVHSEFEMNYTSFQIGANISFHKRMLYK